MSRCPSRATANGLEKGRQRRPSRAWSVMHILVIEDDREAAAYLLKGLAESGHRVDHADEGRHGLECARSGSFDAMIIDRMLPGLDGLSIIAALRAANNQTPGSGAERPGRRRGPRQGPARGRRRLSRQALRLHRTVGPARGADPPRQRRETTGSRSADLEMDLLARTRDTRRARRSTCCRASSACSNI